MTTQQGTDLLFNRIRKEISDSGWWGFGKKETQLVINRILEPHEKSANFPLPESIVMTDIRIDAQGIAFGRTSLTWDEICVSGIKTYYIPSGEDHIQEKSLLLCLHTGKIHELYIDDFKRFKGLVGHHIEQYRLNYGRDSSDA